MIPKQCRYVRSVRAASSLRADMIFGRDKFIRFSRNALSQAVQQDIESAPGNGVASPQRSACLPGKATGRIDSARGRQCFETRQKDFSQSGRVDRPTRRTFDTTQFHQAPPVTMPRCSMASGLIICGVQGGS